MKVFLSFFAVFFIFLSSGCSSYDSKSEGSAEVNSSSIQDKSAKQKILFVLTSHSELGSTGDSTGFYLSEAAHPWKVLSEAGYTIDFVSPKGGKVPVDGFDLEDKINREFWNDPHVKKQLNNTMKPSDVDPSKYVAIHYAGGHGTMWDFPGDSTLAGIAAGIYENGGVVSAVCHGPAALVNVKLSNGSYLVDGKKVNAFTNEEEKEVGLEEVVPFLLEDKLTERGAIFEESGKFEKHVTVDQRLITGQNPASATGVGKAVLSELNKSSK